MSAVGDRTSELGVSDFLAKPVDVDMLIRKVSSYFRSGTGGPPDTLAVGGGARFLDDDEDKPTGGKDARFHALLALLRGRRPLAA
jgi:hypothetical protein